MIIRLENFTPQVNRIIIHCTLIRYCTVCCVEAVLLPGPECSESFPVQEAKKKIVLREQVEKAAGKFFTSQR